MKSLALLAVTICCAAQAAAQQRTVGTGQRVTLPSHSNHFSWERGQGFNGGLGGGVWIVEREVPVIVEREVVIREVPAPAVALPPEPRKPYKLGASYASLPGGCMKMIEGGASYYWCGGAEWYRLVGGSQYRAVAKP